MKGLTIFAGYVDEITTLLSIPYRWSIGRRYNDVYILKIYSKKIILIYSKKIVL